jgi:carbon-monoxide dehydrogenase medium subunit
MLDAFRIHEPGSVREASRLLGELGSEATVYAGGTELLVVMKERLVHYPHLINIKTIPGLDGIAVDGPALVIGALATHKQIERSHSVREVAPLFAELAANVANVRVRSTGTIGGNLCFAEPHSDPATLLIAWDATVVLESEQRSRTMPLADFFTGLLETARWPDEVLTAVRIPLPVPVGSAYERFKTHERPSATVAAALKLDGPVVADARIVVGSVGERPVRITEAENLLIGERPAAAIRSEAAAIVHRAIEPTEDAFESVDYKRHLTGVLTTRALELAAARAIRGTHDG